MKCNECKAEWNVSAAISASIKTCPFCGAELFPKPTEEVVSFQGVIQVIIDHGGIDLLKDGRKSLAMFSDLAPKLRREKTMYSYLVQCDGNLLLIDALKKTRSKQIALRGRLAQEMMDIFLITEQVAYSTCDCFWEAIGGAPFQEEKAEDAASSTQKQEPPKPVSPPVPEAPVQPKTASKDAQGTAYFQAVIQFNKAYTREEFDAVIQAFKALGSYSNSEEMVSRVSQEWANRVKKADALYKSYLEHLADPDPVATKEQEIALLKKEKAECESSQTRLQTLKDKLDDLQKRCDRASEEIASHQKRIDELSASKSFFGLWSGKDNSQSVETYRRLLSRAQAEKTSLSQQIADTHSAIIAIPEPYQARHKIQEIEAKIRQLSMELNSLLHGTSRKSELDHIRKQITDPKYLTILVADQHKARELCSDPVIAQAAAKLTPSGQPLAQEPLSFSQMVTMVKSNAKATDRELSSIFDEGKKLLSTGDYEQGLKFIKFAADRGTMEAHLILGECYELGKGVSPAWRVAEAYYRRAAVSGNHEAEYRLGRLLRTNNGFGGGEWLQKAAKAGHPEAIRLLKNGR